MNRAYYALEAHQIPKPEPILAGFKLWDPRPSIYRKYLTVTKLLDAVEDACRNGCHIISIRRIEPEVRKK